MRHEFDTAQFSSESLVKLVASAESVSISLLDYVDGTIDAMTGVASIMGGMAKILAEFNDYVQEKPVVIGDYIDSEGLAVDAMLSAASSLKNFLTKLVVKRTAIDKDFKLEQHHREALHDSYEMAISEVAELVEVVLETRASVISHDLAAEPRDSKVFNTVNELLESLKQQ